MKSTRIIQHLNAPRAIEQWKAPDEQVVEIDDRA
jgi:hypothetical protein